MKNKVLKILIMISIFLTVIGIRNVANANSISKIDMDIYVDNDGNAEVTEIWICSTNKGTECYHPYYNLGNSKITDLRVTDKDQTYTTIDSWDTSGTINSKSYKCGINEINNGIEICWGISKYGSNVYTVKYKISNFVSELDDCQMMYWTLIPYDFSNSIGDVKVKIHADKYFEDTIPVWGYGYYGGLCYVKDGAIYLDSDRTLKQSEYITFLAKFPKETFNTNNILKNDFEHYFDMAEEGSTKYNSKRESIFSIIAGIFAVAIHFIVPIIIVIISCFAAKGKKYGFKYGNLGKKTKDAMYYRDIPCDGDIFRAYYIAYQYDLMKNKTDILGAIILKWLKTGKIRTEQKERGKIFKKENTVIVLNENKDNQFEDRREKELFKMMYEASEDGILENKEFEKWCKKSYDEILKWFDQILEEQRTKLVADGLIIFESGGLWGKKYTAMPELKAKALELAGLKKFLLDFTRIKERKAIEVELFEDYLIYAQLLGIANQVSKQFKELYPDLIEQSNYASYDNIIYINYCASRGISSANSARAAAQSYSSGGGGFSSGGGGGGSFGGGGGRRRFPLKYDKTKNRLERGLYMYTENKILIGKNKDKELFILPDKANRHGLITGASGSGKTITLKVMAESFSSMGVPVFLADIKGDLAGTCMPGESSEKIQERLQGINITDFKFKGFPTVFWDVFGKSGHPIRTTLQSVGPTILSRMLGLNETQEGVLAIIFKIARENGYELLDLKDLRLLLQYVAENSKNYTINYGNIAAQSVGTIQRSLLMLEEQGGNHFFGEPAIDINDIIKTNSSGLGNINILHCVELYKQPNMYACFMLWLLSTLNANMPEVGDLEKPKMVFFFDEAHLLFDELPTYMLTQVIQIVKLIRSKGIGLYFISQSPKDIPGEILAQLGNKVQHTLRAYTPAEQKTIRAVADSFRANPNFDTEEAISSLGTGEALISFLNEKGEPDIVEKATILPPQSLMGTIDDSIRLMVIAKSDFNGKYDTVIDRVSAFEILSEEIQGKREAEEQAQKMKQEEKQKAELEKAQAKADKEADKIRKEEEKAEKEAEKERKELEKEAEKARKNSWQYKVGKQVERTTNAALNSAGRKVANELLKAIFGKKR